MNENAKYLCPNCFDLRPINDVRFRRNVRRTVPDIPKLRLWRQLHPEGEPPACGRCAADWRQYPACQRGLEENGVIRSLRDYNGDLLEVRICPACGFPLPSLEKPAAVLLSWGPEGTEEQRAAALFDALSAAGWPAEYLPADPEERLLARRVLPAGGGEIQFPIGPAGMADTCAATTLHAQRANLALLWLAPERGENPDDFLAIRTVLDYTEGTGARGMPTDRPVVACFEGDDLPAENAELNGFLKAKHRNLWNCLEAYLTNRVSVRWAGPDSAAAIADLLTMQLTGRPVPAPEPDGEAERKPDHD